MKIIKIIIKQKNFDLLKKNEKEDKENKGDSNKIFLNIFPVIKIKKYNIKNSLSFKCNLYLIIIIDVILIYFIFFISTYINII